MIKNKHVIRKEILAKRANIRQNALSEAEEAALNKLIPTEQYRNSKVVMAYMDFRNEVPTGKIIRRILSDGKKLVLPLTDSNFTIIAYEIDSKSKNKKKDPGKSFEDFFIESAYGISEPNPALCAAIDPSLIDLVIIPGSAFDRSGNRIGYGKGCYDRFLPLLRKDSYKIALAYDFQVLEQIPTDPADVKMDEIITVL
jgi:5,10-methenyltetrahydrofolate synthetase